jgi:hypothetical protein
VSCTPVPDTYVPDPPCPTGTPTIGVPDFPDTPVTDLAVTGLGPHLATVFAYGSILLVTGVLGLMIVLHFTTPKGLS